MPDSFRIGEKRTPALPTVSMKPPQQQKKLSKDDENEEKQRKKCAHFGTSTRDGIVLQKFDENDEKLRETHIPKSKFDDKG